MSDFLRRYGPIMTGYIMLSLGVWMVGLIILPQITMIDYSLWTENLEERDLAERAIETQFVERQKIDSKVRRLKRQLDTAEESDKAALTAQLDELAAARMQVESNLKDLEGTEVEAKRTYSFANYITLFANKLHRSIFFKTIWASMLVTFTALVVCYPISYYLAQVASGERAAMLMLGLIIPYWINEILRTFAWLMILSYNGIMNKFLGGIGAIVEPVNFLDGNSGVLIGMVYAYILFMVFPIYNTIETLDKNQIEAARDLGSPWWRIHWRIVIPHAKPGIAVGCIMTFMLAAGSYAVPAILGGPRSLWFTQIIYSWFFDGRNWNLGSAYALVLLIICVVFIMLAMRAFRVSVEDMAR